ncbi:amino acid/amide ABC transporter membrane protein 1 (HAAT family) [Halospina denitrificans]|uniref:Amino acid/amide ABC transporter membrane protein 1 (HAAT family) n=1 Tax=Halospina denitrificans TaxID=332522 RepID=A0A4R7JI97_9GAMM|nr:urea ABC transporter permease subunit UrtB [Halospina denitrificans]TDT37026.1 amino acid/amide ABC transporter membrane protein 1 (HAAT family) [Halospina denitrificans]
MSIRRWLEPILIVCLLIWPCMAASAEADGQALLTELAEAPASGKAAAITAIAESGDPRARHWLQAFADNKLSRMDDSGRFVVVLENRGRDWTVEDALTGEAIGEVSRRNLNRVRINNSLRSRIGNILGLLDLKVDDPAKRREAARELRGEVDAVMAESVESLMESAEDEDVRDYLAEALAIHRVQRGDVSAIDTLRGSLSSEARSALNKAASSDDPELASAASEALTSIEQLLKINNAAETLYFGLSLGSVLALAAVGLAITFGVMGVINMAHGELIMLGAYSAWGMQQLLPGQPGLALVLAVPVGFMVSASAGIVIERSIIQFLKGRPLETLLATFGVSLILQQLVRTVISPLNRTVVTPEWMSGSLMINEALSLTFNRLYILGFALAVFAALLLVMRRTRLGLEVRAVTQNRAMARSMGIRATRVDIMTFALGSGVAGLAGVALSQITNVGPNLGQNYIVDSFMVVVFGGVGNLLGTLVAGLSLGTINQLLEPWAGAVLAKVMVLVFIILFIQKRPRGLFPQKGRAAEG